MPYNLFNDIITVAHEIFHLYQYNSNSPGLLILEIVNGILKLPQIGMVQDKILQQQELLLKRKV